MPQGSLLGPILFLIFINDLDTALVNSILKFADDTKLFVKVNNDSDRESIQQDLHGLLDWSDSGLACISTAAVHVDTSSVRSVRVTCEFHSYEQFLCRSCFYLTRMK